MPHDVFISYSSHDLDLAIAVCITLEAQGIRCWFAPLDGRPGVEWAEDVLNAINACRIVVLVFSADANDSPQVRREVERAVSKGKILVPLRAKDVLPTRAMEFFIPNTQWLDAFPPPPEPHLIRLCGAVKAFLGNEPLGVVDDATRDAEGEPAPATNRLSSTQSKVLSILTDGPQSSAEIVRSLVELYGSETRSAVVHRLIEKLVADGLVIIGDDGRHSLTPRGTELAATEH